MKISVNDVELNTIGELKKDLFKHYIPSAQLDAAVGVSIQKLLLYKYERCMERLRKEWEPKLQARSLDIPFDDDAFATLVFAQPDYKDRKARMLEEDPDNAAANIAAARTHAVGLLNHHKANLQ